MNTGDAVKRALAVSLTLAIAGLGVTATTGAAMNPGEANGHGQSKHEKGPKAAKKPKPEQAATADHGPKPGQGPKHDQGPEAGGDAHGPAADPPGNNGTVKITPHGEVDGIPQNTPHVGCVFDVEWYGFDEGEDIVSQVTFEAWAPTAVPMTVDGPASVFVGGDAASGAGTDSGFDGEATYTLAFEGEPHPQQGYHVKLTVHTPGSQGADTKHKVFWVTDCQQPVPPDEETPPSDEETTPSDDETDVAGEEESETPDHDAEVKGAQATRAGGSSAVPSAVSAGTDGVGWTASTWPVLLLLLGAALSGLALLARRRRG